MVESGSVDNPLTESPNHISISEGDRSPPKISNSGNSYSGPPPLRSVSRNSPRFSGTRPTAVLEKWGSHSTPQSEFVLQIEFPSPSLSRFQNLVTFIH